MTKILDTFDEYARNAWLYPAALVALPIVLTIFMFDGLPNLRQVTLVAMFMGLPFFTMTVVRGFGKKLEERLSKSWGGMPTTKLLRHRDNPNETLMLRRRKALEDFHKIKLPSKAKESRDPIGTDKEYEAATRQLIPRVRDKQETYPRLHQENINYGFRRNLLALKWIAVPVLCVLILLDAYSFFNRDLDATFAGVTAIHILALCIWLTVVRSNWVLQAGQAYAERLFETLEVIVKVSPDKGIKGD